MKSKEELEVRYKYNLVGRDSAKKLVEKLAKEKPQVIKSLSKEVLEWLMVNVQWAMYEARLEEDNWMKE